MGVIPREWAWFSEHPESEWPMRSLTCPSCSLVYEAPDNGQPVSRKDALCAACSEWEWEQSARARAVPLAVREGVSSLLRRAKVPRSLVCSREEVERETGEWGLNTGLSPLVQFSGPASILLAGAGSRTSLLAPARVAVAWAAWRCIDSAGRLDARYVRLDDWLQELDWSARARAVSEPEKSPLAIYRSAAAASVLVVDAWDVVARRLREADETAAWVRHVGRLVRQRIDDQLPTIWVWSGSLEDAEACLEKLSPELAGRFDREFVRRAAVRTAAVAPRGW